MSSAARRRLQADEQLDAVFTALADRTRRAMLERLAHGPATVTELAGPLPVSLPAVSRHLKVLERAGLVQREVQGRIHRCTLGGEALRDVEHWLAFYGGFWEGQLEALERFTSPAPSQRPGKGGTE